MKSFSLLGALAVLSTVVMAQGPGTQIGAPGRQAFVRDQLHLSDGELAALNQGRPVVKTLPGTMKREVTTAGGIRVDGSAMARFVEQFKTLEGFRKSSFILQIGKFSAQPDPRDMDALTLDAADIDDLRACRVGSCDVRLSADDITKFATQVNWRAPAAAGQATALYKSVLMARLEAYRAGGIVRLQPYVDDDPPLDLPRETLALLDARPTLLDRTPAFRQYVRSYPANPPQATEDFFYWSKEAFGFKPVIGLNHVSVHASPAGEVMIVTTQFYASHYMDGSVAVNALLPDARGGRDGFYWLYTNRSRIDRLGGLLGALSRPIIQRRARAGLVKSFTQTKERLEAGR